METPDGQVGYTYIGKLYALDMSKPDWRKLCLLLWLMPGVGFALFLCMGLLDNQGMRQIYIALPYVFLLLPLAMLLADAYKFPNLTQKLRRQEYEKSVVQMRGYARVWLILSGLLCIASIVYLGAGAEKSRAEIGFLLGSCAQSGLSALFLRVQGRVRVTELG